MDYTISPFTWSVLGYLEPWPCWCLPRISNGANSPRLALLYRRNFGRVWLQLYGSITSTEKCHDPSPVCDLPFFAWCGSNGPFGMQGTLPVRSRNKNTQRCVLLSKLVNTAKTLIRRCFLSVPSIFDREFIVLSFMVLPWDWAIYISSSTKLSALIQEKAPHSVTLTAP